MKDYIRRFASARVAVQVGVLLAMTGCGAGPTPPASTARSSAQSGGDETPHKPASMAAVSRSGSGNVSAEIGHGGGRLELSEGPRVVLPAGTTEPREFVLQIANLTTAFSNNELEKPVGPTFTFSPGLEAAGAAIEVSLPLPNLPEGWGEPALAYEYPISARVGAEDSVHTKWQYEDAQLSGGRITAKVDALPGMRLQFVLSNLEAQ